MNGYDTQFNYERLLLNAAPRKKTQEAFYHEPTSPQEESIGALFFVASIDIPEKEGEFLLQEVFSRVKEHVYGFNEKIQNDEMREALLMEALKRANDDVLHILKEHDKARQSLALIVGLYAAPHLLLSKSGAEIGAYIFHRNRLVNITEGADASAEPVSDLRVFEELAVGELQQSDTLFVSNVDIHTYLTDERIAAIFSNITVEQIELLTEALEAVPHLSLACLSIHEQKIDEREDERVGKGDASERSLSGLIGTQQKTQQYLQSSLTFDVKKIFQFAKRTMQNILLRRQKNDAIGLQAQAFEKERQTPRHMRHRTLFYGTLKNIPRIAMARLAEIYQWFNHLRRKQKIYLLAVLLLVFFLSDNIVRMTQNQSTTIDESSYEQQVQDISNIRNSIDANLLISNEEKAATLLQEAETKIAALSRSSKEKEKTYNGLLDSLQPYRERVQKKTVIENPNVLTQTTTVVDPATFFGITVGDANIHILSQDVIARLPMGEGIIETLSSSTPLPTQPVATTLNGTIVYVSTANLVELNPENNEAGNRDITLPEETLKAAATYGLNLYLLAGSQIYKYRQASDYGTGSAWVIGDSSFLSDAKSIAIDGAIYALAPQEMKKYVRGLEQAEFSLTTVDPPLENATQVVTDIDFTYLYVLESQQKRVLVFKKDGTFVQQYIADALGAAHSFVVREKEGIIYALTDTQVISFRLN